MTSHVNATSPPLPPTHATSPTQGPVVPPPSPEIQQQDERVAAAAAAAINTELPSSAGMPPGQHSTTASALQREGAKRLGCPAAARATVPLSDHDALRQAAMTRAAALAMMAPGGPCPAQRHVDAAVAVSPTSRGTSEEEESEETSSNPGSGTECRLHRGFPCQGGDAAAAAASCSHLILGDVVRVNTRPMYNSRANQIQRQVIDSLGEHLSEHLCALLQEGSSAFEAIFSCIQKWADGPLQTYAQRAAGIDSMGTICGTAVLRNSFIRSSSQPFLTHIPTHALMGTILGSLGTDCPTEYAAICVGQAMGALLQFAVRGGCSVKRPSNPPDEGAVTALSQLVKEDNETGQISTQAMYEAVTACYPGCEMLPFDALSGRASFQGDGLLHLIRQQVNTLPDNPETCRAAAEAITHSLIRYCGAPCVTLEEDAEEGLLAPPLPFLLCEPLPISLCEPLPTDETRTEAFKARIGKAQSFGEVVCLTASYRYGPDAQLYISPGVHQGS